MKMRELIEKSEEKRESEHDTDDLGRALACLAVAHKLLVKVNDPSRGGDPWIEKALKLNQNTMAQVRDYFGASEKPDLESAVEKFMPKVGRALD